MTGNEVVDRGTAAAVRHLRELNAGDLGEPLDDNVLLPACSSPERIVQPRLLLRKSHQFGNRINAERGMHRQDYRLARQLDDWYQILQRIDIELEDVSRACNVIGRDKDRIAVRRALGRCLDPDIASSTRPVLDVDLLAEST
jgi:hypothetical protein